MEWWNNGLCGGVDREPRIGGGNKETLYLMNILNDQLKCNVF